MLLSSFTLRQLEVLEGCAHGKTDDQIAADLCMDHRTVKTHLSRLRDKTGCRTRCELACYYVKHVLTLQERERLCKTPVLMAFAEGVSQLRPAQLRVLHGVARNPGMSYEELERLLLLSHETIKIHLRNICKQCGIRGNNRTLLTARYQLLQPEKLTA